MQIKFNILPVVFGESSALTNWVMAKMWLSEMAEGGYVSPTAHAIVKVMFKYACLVGDADNSGTSSSAHGTGQHFQGRNCWCLCQPLKNILIHPTA